ncbi:NAD(P)-dependent oxidoreductase [Yinghuangia seranimata]|uniref:NAD(P)-dependent oxidoreductase n=1 Tax=Yinghuangia seranimata TaxID=408067 RepID=UPI00248BEFC6|nr:DUF1932 domain-containing protein [Yinghuangia seranimata]MDI2127805.1 DUF1932 domain-containing protein [Yinghuangia seranimata]
MTTVGILHPGSMGAAVAGELTIRGVDVLWCPQGRSAATADRAARFGLEPVRTLRELVDRSALVISLCPSDAAEPVATAVADLAFGGLYVEANAISPDRVARIAELLVARGASVVDGAVVGSPPSATRSPHLYLSGASAEVAQVARLFEGTKVQARALPGALGQASGLKLSYTAYQKASRALAAVAHALADEYDVTPELLDIAREHGARHLADLDYAPDVAAKAQRWTAELHEVTDALKSAGLPAEMVSAAATVMFRLSTAHGDRQARP